MSINPTVSKVPTVTISGRVSSVDPYPVKAPTRWTTLVRLPAPDQYSTPATVELVSNHFLGNEGDMLIDVVCSVGGRYRSYPVTDKGTGEIRTVRTAENLLTVL